MVNSRTSLVSRIGGNAYVLLTLATLAWGGNAIAGRLAVGEISPMALTSLRWIVAVIVILALSGREILAEWRRLGPAWPRVAAMGALGFTAFNAIFYWAAHHTSAVNIGVIQGVTPAVVMGLGLLVYGTRIGALQIAGLFATLVGVGVIASRGDLAVLSALDFNVGDLGIVVASILYAGYTVALRTRPPVSPIALFSAMASAAFLSSLPLVGLEVAAGTFQAPTPAGWAIVAFVGLMPSLAAQMMFMRGVELIGPSRAGLFINLVPVFSALLGVVVLGELFAIYHAVALALVLGGIWLAEQTRR